MRIIIFFIFLIFVFSVGKSQSGFRGNPGKHTVRPAIIDDVLYNPGKGITTANSYDGDVDGYPRSRIAYWRFYWNEIEPENGKFRWDIIDDVIKTAKSRGQRVALGIMPANGTAPEWYRQLGAKGFEYTPERGGESWMPDHNDPLYLEYMGRIVEEMGKRYDGNPDIDHIDMRSLGHWGEWHFGFIEPRPEVKPEIRKALVDIYLDNFDVTPLIMLIGGKDELAYAVQNGTGWRADCLGDLGYWGPDWNHMKDSYQQSLDDAEANDAWKYAPVCFESCGVMQKWADEGYDIKFIMNEALRWHISIFNNKSSPIPPRWWGEIEEFIKKMGYRFVINYITLPSKVKPGEVLQVESEWENLGVAPPYRNYQIAFKLIPVSRRAKGIIIQDTSNKNTDITEWLPGKHALNLDLIIPEDMKPGKYNLAVALLDPFTKEVAVKLAIEGRDSHGWYNLSELEVE
jgi:ribosomal protein S18 acetylase RimI-like enzyme